MFQEYKKLDLSKICSETNNFWKKNNVFEKSINSRAREKRFVFYEGPPSANGLPGIHHIMARLIKDIFCRYKTLSGFRVERKAGWDTHGLPVELSVEKELGIKKDDIGDKISVSDYNRACKKTVMKYTAVWNDLTEKMGYWLNVDSPYITYENKYIESVWFLIKKLYKKDLVYKGYTIQPYSPAAGTGLSSHELNQPGCYREVKDVSVVALFRLRDTGGLIKSNKGVFMMAWTTTPWTLFANTGLAVGKKIKYVFIETLNPYTFEEIIVVCAKECLVRVFDDKTKNIIVNKNPKYPAGYIIIRECFGEDLVDLKYDQLLNYVQPMESPELAFRVVDADFVTTSDGTGVVHLAPTFGADDFSVAKEKKLPLMLVEVNKKPSPVVDLSGKFISGLGEFSGRFVKKEFNESSVDLSVDVDIVIKLKKSGFAFKSEKYEHSYPHCWRTDKPILYYPLDSWFIKSTKYRDLMIKKNEEINWKPKSTGVGRFKNWLENLNDWNLSRSRFWGIPLPIWRTKSGDFELCVGSVEELRELCEESVDFGFMKKNPLASFQPGNMDEKNYNIFDLHKNYVDDIVLKSPSGKRMYREKDVIDVWFDSGSMPYAQWHYPFENKELIDSRVFFPADFIAEGVDQTRGWFFTLHAISVMCFGDVAFKNVISNGLVLDKVGQKMSKRLGNSIDPFEIMQKHGADAVRWYMITNSQPWDNLKFDSDGIVEIKQKLFSTLYNIYSFFALYANIDKFNYSEKTIHIDKRPILDQWILSELNSLIVLVESGYEQYDPTSVGRLIQVFVVDKLSNWYVRLCRRRFWKGDYDFNKISAFQTLYECLLVVSKLASPIAPFFMDRLFCDLNNKTGVEDFESVHLSLFPSVNKKIINSVLERKMRLTKDVCSLALSLRKKEGIRVRQPLSTLSVSLGQGVIKEDLLTDLILAEINVKNIQFVKDSSSFVKKKLSVNFPVVGKKFGPLVKDIVRAVGLFGENELTSYIDGKEVCINLSGKEVKLNKDDLRLGLENMPGYLTVKNENFLVSLNTNLTKDLVLEGVARELVNFIQALRKSLGFAVLDNISLSVFGNKKALLVFDFYGKYIQDEVLASEIVELKEAPKKNWVFEFNNYKMYIAIHLI